MKNRNRILILMLLLLFGATVSAQTAVIKASIDSTQLLIGEQTKIHIEVAADKNAQLQLPLQADTLMKGIEVLEISKIDTMDIGNDRIQLKYDFLVTSFDSALYLLPPFELISGVDTSYSNELALKVSTLPVDTESGQFYDIKDVANPEFVIWDYIDYILYPFLALLLVATVVYFWYRVRTKKTLLPFKRDVVILPPHVVALRELDSIKEKKLWQHSRVKEYHSEITDALRKYLENRFSVSAMELTSGEILEKLKGISDTDYAYDNLKQILLLADVVKFAKYQPLPDENELSIMNAYLFVNNTKIEEITSDSPENNLDVKGENEENK